MKKSNSWNIAFIAILFITLLAVVSCSPTLAEQPPGIEAKEEASKNVAAFEYEEDSINQQKSNR